MPRRALFRLAVFIGVLCVTAGAETPIPPAPREWVTDTAGFMSPAAATELNSRLKAYQEETQHQLLVWIGTTTDGVPIEDWAVRAFEAWKIGRKGIDDGLALFIMTSDRKLRIEVGYGLEGEVPDIIAGRIINDVIVPRIRAGDNDGAVAAGMEVIADRIGGPPLPGARVGPRLPGGRPGLSLFQLLFLGLVAIVFLIVLIRNPALAILLMSGQGRGRRGGWGGGGGWSGGGWGGGGWGGGGGGGWSGGGGRSGGGGASGSW
ncbi:MAG TPA: TPM domain-containing protein [Terriglobia bacterium]|nr:TPM domain-containing protein [Terriglobia bacterium]